MSPRPNLIAMARLNPVAPQVYAPAVVYGAAPQSDMGIKRFVGLRRRGNRLFGPWLFRTGRRVNLVQRVGRCFTHRCIWVPGSLEEWRHRWLCASAIASEERRRHVSLGGA